MATQEQNETTDQIISRLIYEAMALQSAARRRAAEDKKDPRAPQTEEDRDPREDILADEEQSYAELDDASKHVAGDAEGRRDEVAEVQSEAEAEAEAQAAAQAEADEIEFDELMPKPELAAELEPKFDQSALLDETNFARRAGIPEETTEALFAKTHGGPFDKNSRVDRLKMKVIQDMITEDPTLLVLSPTQFALKVYARK